MRFTEPIIPRRSRSKLVRGRGVLGVLIGALALTAGMGTSGAASQASTQSSPASNPNPTYVSLPSGAGFENFEASDREPWGITVDQEGNTWIAEQNGGYIDELTPTDQLTQYPIGVDHAAANITVGPDGNIWWTECLNGSDYRGNPVSDNSIGRLQLSTGTITEFPAPADTCPSGITAGPDGNLWVTLSNSAQIARVTANGQMTYFPIPNDGSNFITTGPDGNLWYTTAAGIDEGTVGRITPAGVVTVFATGLPAPEGITVGPDGALWFTEAQAEEIGRITTDGQITQYPIPTYPSYNIAAGPDGNLWLGIAGGLMALDPATGLTQMIDATGNVLLVAANDETSAIDFTMAGSNLIGQYLPSAASAPTFSSAASDTTAARSAFTYTVSATGSPTPAITLASGSTLPAGVSLTDNGNGTATLAGTSAVAPGVYTFTLEAANGISPDGTQNFILTIEGAPTTSVLTPSNGAAVSGMSAILDATASAAAGVATVQFLITGGIYDQSVIGTATPTTYGYLFGWNTTSVPGGTYSLQSLATDDDGNIAHSSGITITVDNTPPTTAVLIPSNGADLSRTSAILDASASASYGVGISRVQFVLSGGSYKQSVIGMATPTAFGYLYSWNTTSVSPGTYTLRSRATDAAGNTAYSAGITVTVDNIPPATAVLIPWNGETLKGVVVLDAWASAPFGVKITEVQFVLTGGSYNKAVIGTATPSIFGWLFVGKSTRVPDGSYTLQSLATDAAGNAAYSSGVTIKVAN
jgi:streptogramin lyase